jgi:hypothetical protein
MGCSRYAKEATGPDVAQDVGGAAFLPGFHVLGVTVPARVHIEDRPAAASQRKALLQQRLFHHEYP